MARPASAAAAVAAGLGRGDLGELLAQLESASEAHRRTSRDLRTESGPRIPRSEHLWRPGFRPPPAREEIRQGLEASKDFARFVRAAGEEFDAQPGSLKPKAHDHWTLVRLLSPDRSFAKVRSQICFRAHPEEMSAPPDTLCTTKHQTWLKEHSKQRDKAVYPVYHALCQIDLAQQELDSHDQKKAKARDMTTRDQLDVPQFSNKAACSLAKVKRAVATTRTFNKVAGIDSVKREEERLRRSLERKKSAEVLRVRPRTPEGHARHGSRPWAGPDRPLRSFKEATPWRERDETEELRRKAEKQSMRRTF